MKKQIKNQEINLQLFAESVTDTLKNQEKKLEENDKILLLEREKSDLTAKVKELENDKKKLLEANQKMFNQIPLKTIDNEIVEEETKTLNDIAKMLIEKRSK